MVEPVIIGDCKLYLGDCAEILPTLGKVDAVVTDPPYGIGEAAGKNKSRTNLAAAKDYGNQSWDDEPASIKTIRDLRHISNHQIIFGGNYFELPPANCWLVWDKLNGANDFADCELAWTNLDKAVRRIKYRWAGMLQQDMKNKEERVHPTQKPIEVMRWCIGHLPEGSDLILDPYMGSGTTGVACVKMGRKFIGIERESTHFESACKRINEAYRQPDMFVAPPIKATQESINFQINE